MLLSSKGELRTQFGNFVVKVASIDDNNLLLVTVIAEYGILCSQYNEVTPYQMYVSGPFILKPVDESILTQTQKVEEEEPQKAKNKVLPQELVWEDFLN